MLCTEPKTDISVKVHLGWNLSSHNHVRFVPFGFADSVLFHVDNLTFGICW